MTTASGGPVAAQCFGVLGDPVAHSRSPAMHAAAFAALGLPHRYLAFHVTPDRLAEAVRGARALGFGGLNLTVPHKQAALALCDALAPEAQRIGAVNTIVFEGGAIVGHNTDGRGFAAAVRQLSSEYVLKAMVLGSGGAARAVVDAIASELLGPRGHVRWVSRDPAALAAELPAGGPVVAAGWGEASGGEAVDLLVNCTTVGMAHGPSAFPVPADALVAGLAPGARVVDIVYPRPAGGLLDLAEAAGALVQDGLEMLLWQGVFAEALWLGRALGPDVVAAMRAALR
ncbi:shikimate dehydrogenase [Nannocystis exedens]|uniref:Shikimate dehydrogenase (NADP(+)) n=1 Tax=Nannocystis exedens TaxID=54 RepID=A0A1I2A9J2_9BACT|nr:shikimate dehydrogenase [Nannocystis exedens]PCC69668.1 shikimate 5-dehydrogenase [Nannocystis exedens]SFE39490.1 shikimate dehydrogenase [Nannocystis exedens]